MTFHDQLLEAVSGGVLGGFLATFFIIGILIALALYIYFAFAWMTIAKRKGHKYPWLAWIPIANVAMIFQLGKFHWAWIFLILIPFAGFIAIYGLMIAATWKIYKSLKYPGWWGLAPLIDFVPGVSGIGTILSLVLLGIVAWKKK